MVCSILLTSDRLYPLTQVRSNHYPSISSQSFGTKVTIQLLKCLQGLSSYVLTHVYDAASRGVVIGHDHRYNSERWARLTAVAFINSGIKTYLFRGLVHTPMYVSLDISLYVDIHSSFCFRIPFSVKKLGTACGVMITGIFNSEYLSLLM